VSKKVLIWLFSIFLAICVGLLSFSVYLYFQVSFLHDDFTAFKTDTTNKLTTLQSDLSNLNTNFQTFKTDTTNKLTNLQSDVVNLNSRVTTLNSTFTTFQTAATEHFSAVDSNITGLDTRLTDLANKFAESTVSVRQIYDDVINGVCMITDGMSLGSGFVYSSDGYVITCWHVISNMAHVDVLLHDGRSVRARVIGSDQYSDIAVLKLPIQAGLHPLNLANSDTVASGQPVMVVGNPLGIFESVTYGIVSRNKGMINPQGWTWYVANLIQFDAPANPGNSGGPVFNGHGQVIGIAAYGESPESGIAWAISSSKISRVAQAIIADGTFTDATLPGHWNVEDLTPENAILRGLDSAFGVVFTTATDMGDLRANDIAIAVDGFTIKDSADLFSYIAEYKSVGDTITLTVINSFHNIVEVELTLEQGWVFLS
jgi:putative serine protease PepD